MRLEFGCHFLNKVRIVSFLKEDGLFVISTVVDVVKLIGFEGHSGQRVNVSSRATTLSGGTTRGVLSNGD